MGVVLSTASEGTLIYDLLERRNSGWPASRRRTTIVCTISRAMRGGWQVEADFIAAIRGERPVTRTDFRTGVRYMQFTEAVARSSRHQVPVGAPFAAVFSNPSR